jgi:hypothetical protein
VLWDFLCSCPRAHRLRTAAAAVVMATWLAVVVAIWLAAVVVAT